MPLKIGLKHLYIISCLICFFTKYECHGCPVFLKSTVQLCHSISYILDFRPRIAKEDMKYSVSLIAVVCGIGYHLFMINMAQGIVLKM
jgi:hypothetical protein